MGESQEAVVPTVADDASINEDAVVGDGEALDEIALITAALDAEDAEVPEPAADESAVTAPVEPAPELAAPESEPSDAAGDPADVTEVPTTVESDSEPVVDSDATAFDAIPVTAVPQPQPEDALEPSGSLASVPWWPFLAYLGAWIVLAGVAVWQLLQLPPTQVAYESTTYALMILGGLVMTAVGPLLILAVWLTTRASRPTNQRAGLLTSSLIKGALVTLSGAVVWWAALVIVDYLRLGSLL